MLVGVVVASDAREALDVIKKSNAELYEVRVDSFKTLKELNLLKSIAFKSIFTLRSFEEGGFQAFSSGERIEIFKKLIEMHPRYVDVEFLSSVRDRVMKMARKEGVEIILSYHDLRGTPDYKSLDEIANLMSPGNVRKIVTHAMNPEDNLTVLRLYEKYNNLVAFCMGKIGRISRLMSYYLAPFTYVSLKNAVVDGQFTMEEMRKLIEVMESG